VDVSRVARVNIAAHIVAVAGQGAFFCGPGAVAICLGFADAIDSFSWLHRLWHHRTWQHERLVRDD